MNRRRPYTEFLTGPGQQPGGVVAVLGDLAGGVGVGGKPAVAVVAVRPGPGTGITSTTHYDIAGRPDSSFDGKGTTTYGYDPYTGLLTSENVGAGAAPSAFTATYTADGSLASQTYPNGLVQTYHYDNTDYPNALIYAKAGTPWLQFAQTANAEGQTASQGSPQSSQQFTYDGAGRLYKVADGAPGVDGAVSCVTRVYGFDANSNRTTLDSHPADPADPTGGTCSTAGGTSVTTPFDDADRVTKTGYQYDKLGRTTTVPAADAISIGANASIMGDLTVGYYANDYVASQTQGGATATFALDPDQNREASVTFAGKTSTYHYSDDTDSPSWNNTATGGWNRNISGIDGDLAAIQTDAGAVTLQLPNLHGDIVATAVDDIGATSTSSYTETTEYGQPRTPAGAPETYGWLGSEQRASNDLGGMVLMGVRLYNPATGRFLSTDPIPGGNDNAYVYPADPIDGRDLDGRCGFMGVPWHHCDPYRITDESRGFGQYWRVVRQGRDSFGWGYEHVHAGHVGSGKPSNWHTDSEMYADVFDTLGNAASTWDQSKNRRDGHLVFRVTLVKTKTWYTTSWCGCRTRHQQRVRIVVYYDLTIQADGLPLGVRTAYINPIK
jgi:RHS repeat-associated protein